MQVEVNGWVRLVLFEGAEMGFGWGWGEQRDDDEAEQRGEQRGEDGVAVGDDGG